MRRSAGILACFSESSCGSPASREATHQVVSRQRDVASETELGKLLSVPLNLTILHCLSASFGLLGLERVESGGLGLSLLLKLSDEVTLGPAGQSGEVTEGSELSLGLEAESAEGVWHNHALLGVIRGGAALEDLQLTESGGASGELVGEHATDDLPEDARGCAPVLGTTAWVRVNTLVHIILTNDLVSLDPGRLEDLLAAHDGDALAGQKLLGNDAGKAAFKVAPSVNDQLLFEHA